MAGNSWFESGLSDLRFRPVDHARGVQFLLWAFCAQSRQLSRFGLQTLEFGPGLGFATLLPDAKDGGGDRHGPDRREDESHGFHVVCDPGKALKGNAQPRFGLEYAGHRGHKRASPTLG